MDPLLRRERPSARLNDAFTTPVLNILGQGFSGGQPPDTVGDVGPNHYIQLINSGGGSAFTIYSKLGAVLAGPTTLDSLGSGDCAFGAGDPIVLYDQLADRWLLSEYSDNNNKLCVYASMTSDPISGGVECLHIQRTQLPRLPQVFGVVRCLLYHQ